MALKSKLFYRESERTHILYFNCTFSLRLFAGTRDLGPSIRVILVKDKYGEYSRLEVGRMKWWCLEEEHYLFLSEKI